MATDKVNFNIKYGPKTTFSSTSKTDGTLYVATNTDNTAELHARLGGKNYQISNGKIDDSLSDTSTNALQNKVIKDALDKKTSDLNGHTSNKNNPHDVTFAQLGVLKNSTAATADSTYTKATSSTKFYSVQNDKSGKLGVNVPWTDTVYTLPEATASTLGGVKIGNNVSVSSGIISVPSATDKVAGVTVVYPAASCTTYTSDSGTVTPLAVQKAAKLFAITRPGSTTNKAIVRYNGTNGDVQDSTIIIEDVTNSKDSSKAQVIAIPVSGGKKMVYGYCTDQIDGTSFIGGIFDASATSYPYNEGLAIGGTSGDLLWKGSAVALKSEIPSIPASLKNPNSLTVKGNGTTMFSYDGSAAKSLNIKPGTNVSITSDTSGNITINSSYTNTTYTAGSGLELSGTQFKHKNAVSGGTAQGSATGTLSFGGTFTIPTVTYDTEGHITGAGTTTMTMPSNPNTDEKVKNTAGATSKFYLTGTTSSSTTTGTQVFRTDVYVDTNGSLSAPMVYNALWNDYAELFPKGEETEPGDIIALDISASEERYIKAVKGNKALVGVHSNEYGHLIGGDNCSIEENLQKYIPIGLAGRVWVKVHDEPGLGDYITASDIPGVGEVTTIRDNAIGIVVSKKENGKVKIKII